jgi:glycosyltransferase involved in cell wall biosynthesis
MDLHPDCEFELGLLSRRSLHGRLLERLNGGHFRRADATVALGETMKQRLAAKGVRPDRLHVIGVWSRADEIEPIADGQSPLRAEHDLADRFVVMYSGNAGLIHSFEAICEAMERLKDDARIAFVFVGGGKRLVEVERFAADRGVSNFTRLPYFPRERLSESLAMGDVHLIALRDGMEGVAVPCKTYGIMAAGRPAIFVGPRSADTARHLEAAEAGYIIDTDDAEGLVRAIRELADDAERRRTLGANARQAFIERHERAVGCRQWADLLESLGR